MEKKKYMKYNMIKEKLNRIYNSIELRLQKIEALFITKPQNITYFLGFKIISDAFIVIPTQKENENLNKIVLFLPSWEADYVRLQMEENQELMDAVDVVGYSTPNFVKHQINKFKFKTVGFEDDYLSYKRFEYWKQIFKVQKFLGVSDVINKLRAKKTEKEIELIKRACDISDIGFKSVLSNIRAGVRETDLAIEAEYAMRKVGADDTAYDIIITSGLNSIYPHVKTTEKRVRNGDIVIVDIGAKYKEYCSDMTRTFVFGNNNSVKTNLIKMVLEGQQFALNSMKSGTYCRDIDKFTRDFFIKRDKSLGKHFIHNLGHGIGIDVHEEPYISPISYWILEEGMVVTLEPGLYVPTLGGARIEDVIIITKDGCEQLTETEKEF